MDAYIKVCHMIGKADTTWSLDRRRGQNLQGQLGSHQSDTPNKVTQLFLSLTFPSGD